MTKHIHELWFDPTAGDSVDHLQLGESGIITDIHHGRYGTRYQLDCLKADEKIWVFRHEFSFTSATRDETNEFGFHQTYAYDSHMDKSSGFDKYPVCGTCGCLVMPNRGQGSICDNCDYEFTAHMAHDY